MALGEAAFQSVLEAAKHGAEWAWSALYRNLAGPVTGYLASRGVSDPDDLTSEVFLQIARGIQKFSGDEESFRSWVFVIAHRRLIDRRRYNARRPPSSELPTDASPHVVGGDVEKEALDKLGGAELSRVLDLLTEDQREVLALRIIADLSLQETARVLDKNVGAVKALQRRALRALRGYFERQGVTL